MTSRMTDRTTEIRRLMTLAAPLILAQLAQTSMTFVDTLMVGRLGSQELAGIALGSSVFFFVMIVGMGVVSAVGPLVAQAHGAGDHGAIGRAVRQGMWLATGLSVVAVVLFWNVAPLLRVMGQEPGTVALASGYLRAISWGYLPGLWLAALRNLLEGVSNPRPIMFITFAGVGLNVMSNYTLMFGNFGFPALGLVGTGVASSFVYWVMFLAAVGYVLVALRRYRVFERLRAPDPVVLRELVRIGVPIGLMVGFESGLFTVTTLLMGLVGATELAAHQVAIQCASFAFMVPLGLASATAVRVGQATGRREGGAARQAGFVGMGLSVLFMSLTALAFWLLPEAIVSLYLDTTEPTNAAVVRAAVVFLGFAAMFQLFDGLQVSAAGALRGLRDTRVPMLISLFAYWGVGLGTGAVLAFGLGLGGVGLWLGLVVGLAVAALLLSWRFGRTTRRARLEFSAP